MENQRVSYCTTCKGRLHHLQQTLPKNLEAEKDNPNVEFVILDYDSQDGLSEWIKENFPNEIAQGRLRYVHFKPAPHFKVAHAKNMAHCAATGDIFFNLDADNFIAKGTAHYLQSVFERNPNAIVTPRISTVRMEAIRRGERLRGIGGKIAISRENFERLGGYNEHYVGWGDDDLNLLRRARQMGLRKEPMPAAYIGDSIQHGNDERIANIHPDLQQSELQKAKRTKFERVISVAMSYVTTPKTQIDMERMIGFGQVHINFDERESVLPPSDQQKRIAAFRHSQSNQSGRAGWIGTINRTAHSGTIIEH